MPRPKRTKVASTVAAPTRVAKPLKTAATTQSLSKPRKSAKHPDSFSDDSDELVVRSTRPPSSARRQPEPQKDADFTMTGALPLEDEPEKTPESTVPARTKTLTPRAVLPRGGRATPASQASKSVRSSSSVKQPAKGSLRRRVTAAVITDYASSQEESSLLDPSLLTFGSLDSESPAHGTRPPSAIKVGGTPAHETSILALTNFKRRARQPSLLRMVHQTTEVEDNELDELDDFHPDAESTPLLIRKSGAAEIASDSSNISLSSADSRGKKRKLASPIVQVPHSSPPYDPPSGANVVGSQRFSSPSLPAATIESDGEALEIHEPIEPEIMSETMAPPRSSSLPCDETDGLCPPLKPRQRRRGRAKKPDRDLHAEVEEEEEEEQEEENQPARPKTRSKQKPASQVISTAKLQSLLPRRRNRAPHQRDEYDLQVSDDVEVIPDDSDQDELQLPPPRPAAAQKAGPSRPKRKPTRAKKNLDLVASKTKRSTRTYGRQSSDKENESAFAVNEEEESLDIDEPTEISVDLPKCKLAAIAKKFEEVDDFEMEFESVDVEGGTSSPWR